MIRIISALLCTAALAFAEPALFYSKTFTGSTPAYSEINIAADGSSTYREDIADDQPLTFKLSTAEVQAMFDLAAKLDHFSKPLESGLKVARTGDKTFRWVDGASKGEQKTHEQKFNYSTIPEAIALLGWFDRIVETERGYIELERTVKYDRLGVNQALLYVQTLLEKKRLVAGAQFLPLFDRIIKNQSFINMARDRATMMATTIRAQDGITQ